MWCNAFPFDPERDTQHANDKRCNDLCLIPVRVETVVHCKRYQYETEDADSKDHTNQVKLPEQGLGDLPSSMCLHRRLVVLECACLLCLSLDPQE